MYARSLLAHLTRSFALASLPSIPELRDLPPFTPSSALLGFSQSALPTSLGTTLQLPYQLVFTGGQL